MSLEAMTRMDALPTLEFWQVLKQLYGKPSSSTGTGKPEQSGLSDVGLLLMEDNEAVIAITKK